MELISILRNIVEIGFGLLFLVGAIFNVSYTLRHGEEFYGSFATSASSSATFCLADASESLSSLDLASLF